MKCVGSARVSSLENESHVQERNTVWESARARDGRAERHGGGEAWLCVHVARELNAAAEYTRNEWKRNDFILFYFLAR